MLIIGVDASPLRIAYAITLGDEIISHSLLHTRQGLAERRAAWLLIRADARLREEETGLDVHAIGIEDVWFGLNRRGVLNHSLSVGQTMAWSHTAFPYSHIRLVSPQSWRSACGLPKNGKKPAAEYAARLAGYKLASQDEADAICIAIATSKISEGED